MLVYNIHNAEKLKRFSLSFLSCCVCRFVCAFCWLLNSVTELYAVHFHLSGTLSLRLFSIRKCFLFFFVYFVFFFLQTWMKKEEKCYAATFITISWSCNVFNAEKCYIKIYLLPRQCIAFRCASAFRCLFFALVSYCVVSLFVFMPIIFLIVICVCWVILCWKGKPTQTQNDVN